MKSINILDTAENSDKNSVETKQIKQSKLKKKEKTKALKINKAGMGDVELHFLLSSKTFCTLKTVSASKEN